MTLNYQLHKATEEKIDELVDDKLSLKRREDNLIKKVEEFQKDNTRLKKEMEEWGRTKSLELRRIKEQEEKAIELQETTKKALDEVTQAQNILLMDKKRLDERIKELEDASDLAESHRTALNSREALLIPRERALDEANNIIAEMKIGAQEVTEMAIRELKEASAKNKEADRLMERAIKKDSEANGIKIRLGIKEKALDEREKELNKQQRENKFRRQENEEAAKELQIKRELLAKAYSVADVEELDIKVEQIARTKQKELLPKNRRKVLE